MDIKDSETGIDMENHVEEIQEKKTKSKGREILSWILYLAVVLMIAFAVRKFVFNSVFVSGSSMNPTFQDRDQVFTARPLIIGKNYRHGDVVVFNPPFEYSKKGYFIKRIIGLPGDTVEIKDGKVWLNGKVLEEDYISQNATESGETKFFVVSEESVFVMGDNRAKGASNDSRFFGEIPMKNIEGVVMLRYWPISQWTSIPRGKAE